MFVDRPHLSVQQPLRHVATIRYILRVLIGPVFFTGAQGSRLKYCKVICGIACGCREREDYTVVVWAVNNARPLEHGVRYSQDRGRRRNESEASVGGSERASSLIDGHFDHPSSRRSRNVFTRVLMNVATAVTRSATCVTSATPGN